MCCAYEGGSELFKDATMNTSCILLSAMFIVGVGYNFSVVCFVLAVQFSPPRIIRIIQHAYVSLK